MDKTSGAIIAFRVMLPIMIIGGALGAYAALGRPKPVPKETGNRNMASLVETITIGDAASGFDIEVDGVVVPYREVTISAEVAGRIAFKDPLCKPGRVVSAGQLLMEIDARDYEIEVERLGNDVEQADVSIQEADIEIKNTELLIDIAEQDLAIERVELTRVAELAADDILSDSEHDQAKRAELASQNSLQMLRNRTRLLVTQRTRLERMKNLAELRLAKAELDLERTKVFCPFDGIVVEDDVEQGAYVQPGAAMVTIEDTSSIEVRVSLHADQLQWLWQTPDAAAAESPDTTGVAAARPSDAAVAPEDPYRHYRLPKVPVTVSYFVESREYRWSGVLARYDGPGFDERTRMIPCRIVVPNPREAIVVEPGGGIGPSQPRALVRGMFVVTHIHASPDIELVAVPERAVRPGSVVWAVRDGKLAICHVEIVKIKNDIAYVDATVSDLKSGAEVIVSPLAVSVDGMTVEVHNTTEPDETMGPDDAAATGLTAESAQL